MTKITHDSDHDYEIEVESKHFTSARSFTSELAKLIERLDTLHPNEVEMVVQNYSNETLSWNDISPITDLNDWRIPLNCSTHHNAIRKSIAAHPDNDPHPALFRIVTIARG